MIDRADTVIEWGLGIITSLIAVVWGERKAAANKIEKRVEVLESETARKTDFAGDLGEIKTLIRDVRTDTKSSFDKVHQRIDETNRTILGLATRGSHAPAPRDRE